MNDDNSSSSSSGCSQTRSPKRARSPSVAVDAEQVSETLSVMNSKEQTHYERVPVQSDLAGIWRKMLLEWMFFVIDYCKLSRQSCAAAAFFLDVAMSRGLCKTREDHQLAAATALQLALKTCDTAVIKVEKLVNLGRGQFSAEDIAAMEMKLIQELNWHIHPTTTYCFIRQFEQLLPSGVTDEARDLIDEVTKVVAELTVLEDQYLQYDSSVLGYATMLLAFEVTDIVPVRLRQCFFVRMTAVAKLDSSSKVVLEAFDRLRESLENSGKMDQVMDAIAEKTEDVFAEDVSENERHNSLDKGSHHSNNNHKRASSGIHFSPRDVRNFGSFSSLSNSPISL